jgi:hypothetical protein
MKSELYRTASFGAVSGIAATAVMDVFVAFAMPLMGSPVTFMFSFIGDVASTFFASINAPLAGGVPLGFLIHYGLGLVLGALYCVVLQRTRWLAGASRGRSILAGILYIEVASQPFLVTAPLVLRLAAADTLQWYALSTAMHAIYGTVLGLLQHEQGALVRPRPRRLAA